jgi:hypothetical protein
VGNGDELTVEMPIRFKPGFVGLKKLILFAQDSNGANTDLILKGEWNVSAK